MSVNGIVSVTQTYENKNAAKSKTNQSSQPKKTKQSEEATGVVYEKNQHTMDAKKTYTKDLVAIDKLKAEIDRRTQNLRDLVEKLFVKQGESYTDSTDIYSLLREGKLQVDDETKAQAQKDIAEDGYWGVEKTSDRIVGFAKALSAGDSSKANDLIEGVKKGFEEATKAWGGELPEISQKTLDAAIGKLEAWRDGKETK